MGELVKKVVEYVRKPRVRGAIAATACLGFTVSTLFTHSGEELTESTRVFGACPEGTTVEDADVRRDGSIGPILGWPVIRFACSDGTPASIYMQLMDDEGGEHRPTAPLSNNRYFEAEITFTPTAPDGQWSIELGGHYIDYDNTAVVGDGIDVSKISVARDGQTHQIWGD